MTEKEKRDQGLLYNANFDEQLINERVACKNLCQAYNQTAYSDFQKRKDLLSQIITVSGANLLAEQPFYCDYGYNIELGDNFYSNHNLIILDAAKVKFGHNVFVGPNCSFYTASHPENVKQRNEGLEYARPITVGNNVWFGGNVVVIPGVSIGDNTIIGAGSVVTKDIPADSIAVGNPCRVIRKIADN